jgi:hypothetical protein
MEVVNFTIKLEDSDGSFQEAAKANPHEIWWNHGNVWEFACFSLKNMVC